MLVSEKEANPLVSKTLGSEVTRHSESRNVARRNRYSVGRSGPYGALDRFSKTSSRSEPRTANTASGSIEQRTWSI